MKSIRESKGISQAELSRMTGIPQSVISDIESGKTKAPRIDTLKAIAAALKVSIMDLIEGDEDDTTSDSQ